MDLNYFFVFLIHTVFLVKCYNTLLVQTFRWISYIKAFAFDGVCVYLCCVGVWNHCIHDTTSSHSYISLFLSPISLSTFQGISLLGYKIRWVKWLSVADWDLNVRQSNCISYWIGNKGQGGLPPPCIDSLLGPHAKVDESPEEIERPYQSVW